MIQNKKDLKIFFTAHTNAKTEPFLKELVARHGQSSYEQADVVVAIGGDGFMLRTIHSCIEASKNSPAVPIYGINGGSLGFLMNTYRPESDLKELICQAIQVRLRLLSMHATDKDGHTHEAIAVNDVSLFRQTHQIAKVRIFVDGKLQLEELACDGVLVATPAGSTAYNFSVYGPILPLKANLLALTPISAFRPRRWRGALLPQSSHILFEILEGNKRPVGVVADFQEFRDIQRVEIKVDTKNTIELLFDPDFPLEERNISEQFRQ